MEFSQLVSSRRTVHNYVAEKVSDELVREALRLSLWAPNHKLTFPWVYTWIGPRARNDLAELSVDLKSAKETLSPVKAQATRDNVLTPSHLISLAIRRSDEKRLHEDYATLACSVQIATLQLWSHGVYSKWSTGGWSTHARSYKILGLDPQEVQLEGCLMIGKALHIPPTPERPPLEHFLRNVD